MKIDNSVSFADHLVEGRKIKQVFFNQVNLIVDWRPISNIINKHYSKGGSHSGRPSHDGLVLFKMMLMQTWYGLSDYEVEERVNDSISMSRFVGIGLEKNAPDNTTISRFRTEMTEKNVLEKLFKALNKQLEKHQILVKTGAIIDASIIDSPFKPKGKTSYEIVQDRDENERSEEEVNKEEKAKELIKKTQQSVDTEASWIKKAGKCRYGYKKHVVTDENGLVCGVVTTPAHVNEISNLEEVLNSSDLPPNIPLMADKGYCSEKNKELLKRKKLKNRILNRAKKGTPLTDRDKLRNKLIGKTRYKVERTFGSIKLWFKSGYCRYKGLAKTHTQNIMEALAYNLYRSPGIVASNSFKIGK